MKILIINGSPKGERSNSLQLARAFVEGMGTAVSTELSVADLSKMDIKACKGCFGCWKATPGKCVIKDDMPQVIEQIIAADVVIYSFPLYYFSVPGILKNVIDRQLPMVLPFMAENKDGIGSGSHDTRYDMSGKKFVLVSTCGFYSAQGNYDSVCRMFDHICGKNGYETIFCGQGELFAIDALRNHTAAYLETVKRAGSEFVRDGIGNDTREKLSELIMPKDVFEQMADASWGVSKDSEQPQKVDESLVFTRQMSALYNKNSFDGTERVLEMRYTDIGKTYQIRLKKDGAEVLDSDLVKATTIIETPYSVWKDIADGKISGTEALAKHMYSVDGDFDLMINWDTYFGTGAPQAVEKSDTTLKKPLMITMLIPWCALWTGLLSAGIPGAWAAAVISAAVPMVMHRHEQTIYDKLSSAACVMLSLLAIFTSDAHLAAVAGYLVFGLMWLISCFTKEPVCAAYVKYNYGGSNALTNPIFMKTNYILAAAWGVFYLITSVVSWLLLSSDMGLLRSVIGTVAPAIMGAFTVFFEKWYPRHVAMGNG